MTQTKRDIQGLLASSGLRPLKRYGQNFLIDGNLMNILVEAADPASGDVVLEVGPGTGGLTDHLVKRAGHVVCVEVDRGLASIVAARFERCEHFTLIHRDVLEKKSEVAEVVLETLQARQAELGGRLMLVANLPYQVATSLLIDLLLSRVSFTRLCFTVQAEMADRIQARPGTKDYGPVSILLQTLCDVKRIARLPPQAFWPAPQVDSAMMRLDVREGGVIEGEARGLMVKTVRHAFNHRRKTLKHSLRALLREEVWRRIDEQTRFDLSQRPEQWEPKQWVDFAGYLAVEHTGQGE